MAANSSRTTTADALIPPSLATHLRIAPALPLATASASGYLSGTNPPRNNLGCRTTEAAANEAADERPEVRLSRSQAPKRLWMASSPTRWRMATSKPWQLPVAVSMGMSAKNHCPSDSDDGTSGGPWVVNNFVLASKEL